MEIPDGDRYSTRGNRPRGKKLVEIAWEHPVYSHYQACHIQHPAFSSLSVFFQPRTPSTLTSLSAPGRAASTGPGSTLERVSGGQERGRGRRETLTLICSIEPL